MYVCYIVYIQTIASIFYAASDFIRLVAVCLGARDQGAQDSDVERAKVALQEAIINLRNAEACQAQERETRRQQLETRRQQRETRRQLEHALQQKRARASTGHASVATCLRCLRSLDLLFKGEDTSNMFEESMKGRHGRCSKKPFPKTLPKLVRALLPCGARVLAVVINWTLSPHFR